MPRIVKWIGLAVTCVLVVTAAGCDGGPFGSCSGERPSVQLPDSLKVEGAGPVAVGTALQLHATFTWDSGYKPTQSDELMAQTSLQWSVEPADGAAISSAGIFKATKPGAYVVTVQRAGLSATTRVNVTEPESNDTTEVIEEETTTTEATEETTTTETTVTIAFAGTYKGTWLWTAGQSKADVPWAFVVGDQGDLQGGFDCMLTGDTRVVCVLTGQVSDDGKVDASGAADTTVSGVGGSSTPMTLTGQIADGEFAGELVGSGGRAVKVTATLQ